MAILTQLQSKRLLTSTQLATKFSVSTRTIYRDMRTLEQAGVPITTEEGKGYTLVDGYRLPPVMFTESEANALITAEKLVLLNKDTSFTQCYTEAITKIKSVLRSGVKDKVSLLSERIAIQSGSAPDPTSDLLSSIQLALTNLKVIQLDYYSPNSNETTSRLVEPFAFISRIGESWYLIGWCRLRKDYRLFRFDRIQKLSLTEEVFTPHEMNLDDYLAAYRNKRQPLT